MKNTHLTRSTQPIWQRFREKDITELQMNLKAFRWKANCFLLSSRQNWGRRQPHRPQLRLCSCGRRFTRRYCRCRSWHRRERYYNKVRGLPNGHCERWWRHYLRGAENTSAALIRGMSAGFKRMVTMPGASRLMLLQTYSKALDFLHLRLMKCLSALSSTVFTTKAMFLLWK